MFHEFENVERSAKIKNLCNFESRGVLKTDSKFLS